MIRIEDIFDDEAEVIYNPILNKWGNWVWQSIKPHLMRPNIGIEPPREGMRPIRHVDGHWYWADKPSMKGQRTINMMDDVVTNLLYYDRRNDEELRTGEIEGMIKSGDITIDDLVTSFKESLERSVDVA